MLLKILVHISGAVLLFELTDFAFSGKKNDFILKIRFFFSCKFAISV